MAVYPLDTNRIVSICRQNDVAMVGVFGSLARGQGSEHSDIDLLVRFSKRKGFFALVRLERELEAALERDVDLVTEGAISPYLRDEILADLQVLYDAG